MNSQPVSNVIINAGKIVHINCSTNVGLIEKMIAMIFQKIHVELPVEIQFADNVVPAGTQHSWGRPLNVP